jgi:hypothetical protein
MVDGVFGLFSRLTSFFSSIPVGNGYVTYYIFYAICILVSLSYFFAVFASVIRLILAEKSQRSTGAQLPNLAKSEATTISLDAKDLNGSLIKSIKGIGPTYLAALRRQEIHSLVDLANLREETLSDKVFPGNMMDNMIKNSWADSARKLLQALDVIVNNSDRKSRATRR